MTINSTAAKNSYTGDGTTTSFAYSFTLLNEEHIVVYCDDGSTITTKALETDYTVTGVGTESGGTVEFTTAPASGVIIKLALSTPYLQEVDYSPTERFAMATHEYGFDLITNMFKKLSEIIDRVLKLKVSSTLDADDVTITETADQYLKWNSGATDLDSAELTSSHGITDIVADTSPTLGGDLDANGNAIQFDDATGITDDSSNEQLIFQKTASAVNYVTVTNAATGNSPSIAAAGSDTNIDLVLSPKAAGFIKLNGLKIADGQSILDANGNELITFTTTASAVNYLNIINEATGGSPTLGAAGSDTNISIGLQNKGNNQLRILGTADTAAEIRLYEDTDNGTNYVGLKAPASVASSVAWTLPSADGTAGYGLSTNGSAVTSWTSNSGGGNAWTLLATATASTSSSVDFTSGIDGTYDKYVILYYNVIPASSSDLIFRVSTDAGSSWLATNYKSSQSSISLTTPVEEAQSTITTGIQLNGTNTNWDVAAVAGFGASGMVEVHNPASSSMKKMVISTLMCRYAALDNRTMIRTTGQWDNATTAIDGFRFIQSTGNISSGEFMLYGVTTS